MGIFLFSTYIFIEAIQMKNMMLMTVELNDVLWVLVDSEANAALFKLGVKTLLIQLPGGDVAHLQMFIRLIEQAKCCESFTLSCF